MINLAEKNDHNELCNDTNYNSRIDAMTANIE